MPKEQEKLVYIEDYPYEVNAPPKSTTFPEDESVSIWSQKREERELKYLESLLRNLDLATSIKDFKFYVSTSKSSVTLEIPSVLKTHIEGYLAHDSSQRLRHEVKRLKRLLRLQQNLYAPFAAHRRLARYALIFLFSCTAALLIHFVVGIAIIEPMCAAIGVLTSICVLGFSRLLKNPKNVLTK